MDQNQQQNVYPNLYKNAASPSEPEAQKNIISPQPEKKKYWLRGIIFGLIAFLPFFALAFYIWNSINNFYYPHHGNEISFMRPIGESFLLITFGLPIFIIGGIIFCIIAREKFNRFLFIGGIIILVILSVGAGIYLIKINTGATEQALARCEGVPKLPPGDLYGRDDQFYQYNFCEIIATLGSSVCNNGSDTFKAACLSYAAVTEGKPEICPQISYPDKWSYYDFENLLEHDNYNIICRNFFVKYNKDLSACKKLNDSLIAQCTMNVAGGKNDISTCNNLSDLREKERCYEKIAEKTQDISVCDKISSEQTKERCLSSFATPSDNCSICDKIPMFQMVFNSIPKCENIDTQPNAQKICIRDQSDYDEASWVFGNCNDCFRSLALKTKDYNFCEKMRNDTSGGWSKGVCYYDLAKQEKNPGLCEKIIDSSQKASCLLYTPPK